MMTLAPRRPRPLRQVEHRPAVKPAWLDAHPGAGDVWDELAPGRIALGLLVHLTQEGFAQLCVYVAANRRRPLRRVERAAMTHLMRAFGFPLARGRERRWARPDPTDRCMQQQEPHDATQAGHAAAHAPHTERHTP